MNKNLKNEMVEIVNKEVEAYKDDVNTDFYIIDTDKDIKKWLWIVGQCGTHIIDYDVIQYKETDAFIILRHCLENNYKRYFIVDTKNNTLKEVDKEELKLIVKEGKSIDYESALKLIKRFYNNYKNTLKPNDLIYNIKKLTKQYNVDVYKILNDLNIKINIEIYNMIEAV